MKWGKEEPTVAHPGASASIFQPGSPGSIREAKKGLGVQTRAVARDTHAGKSRDATRIPEAPGVEAAGTSCPGRWAGQGPLSWGHS